MQVTMKIVPVALAASASCGKQPGWLRLARQGRRRLAPRPDSRCNGADGECRQEGLPLSVLWQMTSCDGADAIYGGTRQETLSSGRASLFGFSSRPSREAVYAAFDRVVREDKNAGQGRLPSPDVLSKPLAWNPWRHFR